ncbi:MAG TPA: 2-dehydropantoate 2-reductase [Candidatus Deferrimicrobiaceae bacterium]|nr:2-dehydropantoate 2-reductase [Candidatus Deferrimicrobiaceae bacterium]
MRIAVFGTGGVGGYYGGRLAIAGHDVTFIARGEHLSAIREQGLRVESVRGDFVVRPAQATEDPAETGPVDLVLFAVKAWQVPEAARAMRKMIGPGTVVLPLQNGVEASSQIAAVIGSEYVLVGVARIFSFLDGPGRIRQVGGAASLAFGEPDNRLTERVGRLCETFQKAGVTAEIPRDIHVALWKKFLLIAPLGGVGAVTRSPIGTFRALPETRRMLEEGMREILQVGRARKIPLAEEAVSEAVAFVDALEPGGTTSMQRDILAGRPSELDAWNGAVVRMGRSTGVPTPVHEFLYGSLLPMEMRARAGS